MHRALGLAVGFPTSAMTGIASLPPPPPDRTRAVCSTVFTRNKVVLVAAAENFVAYAPLRSCRSIAPVSSSSSGRCAPAREELSDAVAFVHFCSLSLSLPPPPPLSPSPPLPLALSSIIISPPQDPKYGARVHSAYWRRFWSPKPSRDLPHLCPPLLASGKLL